MIEIYEIRYIDGDNRYTYVRKTKGQFYVPLKCAKRIEDLFTDNEFRVIDKPLSRSWYDSIETRQLWHFLFEVPELDIRILRKDYPEILL